MRKDWIAESSAKAEFINRLQDALLLDQERSGLDSIRYEQNLESRDEIISVIFLGGGVKKILATANSNGANAKEIVRAIYG
jgi:hypothetical protein